MKKYKLLKDTPECKAGMIFKEGRSGIYYSPVGGETEDLLYQCKLVENSPEWFAPFAFVSEDGVDVFDGDHVWYPVKGVPAKLPVYHNWKYTSSPLFSTFGACQDWLDARMPRAKPTIKEVALKLSNKYLTEYEAERNKSIFLGIKRKWLLPPSNPYLDELKTKGYTLRLASECLNVGELGKMKDYYFIVRRLEKEGVDSRNQIEAIRELINELGLL